MSERWRKSGPADYEAGRAKLVNLITVGELKEPAVEVPARQRAMAELWVIDVMSLKARERSRLLTKLNAQLSSAQDHEEADAR